MDAQELLALTQWVEQEVVSRNIPSYYTKLQNTLQRNVQRAPQGSSQPLAPVVEQLTNALREIDFVGLTTSQRDFLIRLGIRQYLAEDGATTVESIVRDSPDDASRLTAIAPVVTHFNEGIARSRKIGSALDGMVSAPKSFQEEALIEVVFREGASIGNVVELKRWANVWHEISRGIAMAANASPEDIRTVGARNGSLILTLATTYGVAKVAASVIMNCLSVVEKILQLRKLQVEIESIKLSNSKVSEELKRTIRDESSSGSGQVLRETKEELRLNLDGEKEEALERSIRRLIDFFNRGGGVDLRIRHESDDSSGEESGEASSRARVLALTEKADGIRRLSSQIRGISFDASNDDSIHGGIDDESSGE